MTQNTETAMLSKQNLNLNLTSDSLVPCYSFATFPNKASRILESLKQSAEYEESVAVALIMFQIRRFERSLRGLGKWANLLLIYCRSNVG